MVTGELRYTRAWDFATIAHEGQTYGGPQGRSENSLQQSCGKL